MQTVRRAKLMIYFNASSGGSSSITVYDGLIKDAGAYAEFLYFWIVNTFSDNFFKVILPVLYRGLISQRGMYPVMVIPVHIIP